MDDGLAADFRIALDPCMTFRGDGRVATGGSPWRIVRFGEAALPFLTRLRWAGRAGAAPAGEAARSVARSLLDRGLAYPVRQGRQAAAHDVDVVVPVLGATALDGCLGALEGLNVIVVDDGSANRGAVASIARRHGTTLHRHGTNLGPAAARNTGARIARTDLVAFVDADCRPQPGWLDDLVTHFDDPRVAVVAPRIVPAPAGTSLIARYEAVRSALDMGRRAELARPGGRLAFVPGATLVARRQLVLRHRFDESLRFGEDVDLVWRLSDAGWLVRYEPAATVVHERPPVLVSWVARRVAYGTSAGALARRHPGKLAPVRLSGWNLAALLLGGTGHRVSAAAISVAAAAKLHRRLAGFGTPVSTAVAVVATGLVADLEAIGRAFRREWWPIGAVALVAGVRSRRTRAGAARTVSTLVLLPLFVDWVRERPDLGPVAYVALRLLDDASYGTGVAVGSFRQRTLGPLVPKVALPKRSPRGLRRPRAGPAPAPRCGLRDR